jgi:hypothetical protein
MANRLSVFFNSSSDDDCTHRSHQYNSSNSNPVQYLCACTGLTLLANPSHELTKGNGKSIPETPPPNKKNTASASRLNFLAKGNEI